MFSQELQRNQQVQQVQPLHAHPAEGGWLVIFRGDTVDVLLGVEKLTGEPRGPVGPATPTGPGSPCQQNNSSVSKHLVSYGVVVPSVTASHTYPLTLRARWSRHTNSTSQTTGSVLASTSIASLGTSLSLKEVTCLGEAEPKPSSATTLFLTLGGNAGTYSSLKLMLLGKNEWYSIAASLPALSSLECFAGVVCSTVHFHTVSGVLQVVFQVVFTHALPYNAILFGCCTQSFSPSTVIVSCTSLPNADLL